MLTDDNVYIGSGNGDIDHFQGSGSVADWTFSTGGKVDATGAISGGVAYLPSTNGDIYDGLAPCTSPFFDGGHCPPKVFISLDSPMESSPAISDGVLYVGADDGDMYAISLATHKVLWDFATKGKVVSSPAVADGLVVFGSKDGNVYGLDASNGSLIFTVPTGGAVTSSPVIAGSQIFVGSDDRKLYSIPVSCSSTCEPTWVLSTGGEWSPRPRCSTVQSMWARTTGNFTRSRPPRARSSGPSVPPGPCVVPLDRERRGVLRLG